jgi:UDP-glucose:(heptosyl)LPS alpha-1,3-glucosyltransferase
MRIAVGIVSLSDRGGLQRDCLALVEALRARGHDVEIFAARGAAPRTFSSKVHILPTRSLTNHGRDRAFARALQRAVRSGFDIVVGFNKLPGLDVYYCADPSVRAKPTPLWRRLSPRHRARLALERACFDPSSATSALMLSPDALASYRETWRTPEARMFVLPPRIGRDRVRSRPMDRGERREGRSELGYDEGDFVWLWAAAQPGTKGLDRALEALARRPPARLLVVGLSPDDRKARPYRRLAERLRIAKRVQWLGHRDDIPELMAMADILVHPARLDVTGQVILEAIANGLPVVASAVCGFAPHVQAAGAGAVIAEPFDARGLDGALRLAADPLVRDAWSAAGLAYCRRHDFARGLEAAAEIVERIGRAKHPPS